MDDYFKTLDTIDPLFHALVVTKLKEIARQEGLETLTIEDLREGDELDILRNYTVALYKEYRTLRTAYLENMVITTKSVGSRFSNN